jgi:hypothetical protein
MPQREGVLMVKIIIIVLVVLAVLFVARMLMARSR